MSVKWVRTMLTPQSFSENKTIHDILRDQLQIFYDDYNLDTFFFFSLKQYKRITNQIN